MPSRSIPIQHQRRFARKHRTDNALHGFATGLGAMPGLVVCLVLATTPLARAGEGDRAAFYALWSQHVTVTNQHREVAGACRAFMTAHTESRLVPLARDLLAWHLLHQGQSDRAAAIWQQQLQPGQGAGSRGTVAGCADDIARAWLTRLDREQLKIELRAFYRREVRYPAVLDELWKDGDPGRALQTDRWGKPWHYQLDNFRRLEGFHGQRYKLFSRDLGEEDDWSRALKKLPGTGAPYRLVQRLSGGANNIVVRLQSTLPGGGELTLALGATLQPLVLVDAGADFVIVADKRSWSLIPATSDNRQGGPRQGTR